MFRLLALFLCATACFAVGPRQLAPIEPPPHSIDGSPALEMTPVGDVAYFITLNQGDRELWKTDGTEAGTQQVLLADSSIRAQTLKRVQNTLYFTADYRLGYISEQGVPVLTDVLVLPELHDAGEGVFAWLRGVNPEKGHLVHFTITNGVQHYPISFPEGDIFSLKCSAPVAFNGKVYVLVGSYFGIWLFSSDGTAQGDRVVAVLTRGDEHSSIGNLDMIAHNGSLYLAINYSGAGTEKKGSVWVSDGTADTQKLEEVVNNNGSQAIVGLTPFQEGVAYVVRDQESHVLHAATTSGNQVLEATRASFIRRLTAHNGTLLYFNQSGLQRLDGTELTTLISQNYPHSYESDLSEPLQADAAGHFHIFGNQNPVRYWVSDGSVAGTTFISEFHNLFASDMIALNPLLVNRRLLLTGVPIDFSEHSFISRTPSGWWEGIDVYDQFNLNTLYAQVAELGGRIIYKNGSSLQSVGDDADVETLSHEAGEFIIAGELGFFWEVDFLGSASLWSTDGTRAHTVKLFEVPFRQYLSLQMVVSGNVLYISNLHAGRTIITRTDGTLEGTVEVGSFEDRPTAYYPITSGDELGGLYYVQPGSEHNRIWYISRQAGAMTLLVETPAYPLPSNVNMVDFYYAAGRVWMFFADFTDGIPNEELRSFHVWTSDGTADGTLLYTDGVRNMSYFRERHGLASFELEFADRRGYVLSSGAEPFSAFSEAPAYYQIDGFDYRETGLRYGVRDEQLWVSDGAEAGTNVLAPYSGWLLPHLRLDTVAGTVLVLYDGQAYRAYLTDGTAAGTQLLFTEEDDVANVEAFDGHLYVTRSERAYRDPQLFHLSAAGSLELVPGTESLWVRDLFVGEKSLLFYGVTPELGVNLYALDKSLTLSYARKYRSQLFYEVSVEPIAGASSYEWSTQDGTLFHPSSSPKVMVKLGANRRATVHLTVTLSDGQVIEGEVTIQAPDRPTGPIYFKGGPVLVNQARRPTSHVMGLIPMDMTFGDEE